MSINYHRFGKKPLPREELARKLGEMSFAVVRGSPSQSQLYLDGVLDSIIEDGGTQATGREGVNLAEVLFYCLKTNPGRIHSINAATDEKFTNEQILKRAVSIARALIAICPKERVIIMLRNHEHMSAMFYAVLLAGIIPFMMAPESTESDFRHFLPLISPRLIFCEADRRDDVTDAVRRCDVSADTADVVVAVDPNMDKFVKGYSDDIDSYKLPAMNVDSTAIILGTSGTTGRPKAAMLTHQGLVIQIPSLWLHETYFPQTTQLVLLLSTAQWLTHPVVMITCPVYQVPILMSPKKVSADYFLELAEKYRPTFGLISPMLAAEVGNLASPEQLSSFSKLNIVGTPFSPSIIISLKDKLPASASLLNAYGMTEVQGQVAVGKQGTRLQTVGNITNIFEYRIVNSDGNNVSKPYEKGELYLRSKCLFKGYLRNGSIDHGNLTQDGWLKTEDVFYKDEEGQLFFANRTKLYFMYLNNNVMYPVFPEEVEQVIGTVPGVQQSVVCRTENGPAAAVVMHPGCDVSRETIQHTVTSTLTDWSRLRGGIALVSALPRTHTGKVHRARCCQLIQDLTSNGECF